MATEAPEGSGVETIAQAAKAARESTSIHQAVTSAVHALGMRCSGLTYTDELARVLERCAEIAGEAHEPGEDARELAAGLRECAVLFGMDAVSYADTLKVVNERLGLDNSWLGGISPLLNCIADRIERLAAPGPDRYVALPVDRDGVPIRPGETLYNEFGYPWTATRIVLLSDGTSRIMSGATRIYQHELTHTKPHTIETIVSDCCTTLAECDVESVERYIREAYELGRGEAQG